ncbi:nitroreductase family protein [Clostridium aminobutyricum]|uniref:Nitroreductase family protein n=1 Tax=Clostridium aminobutyricum TaxID=33953 RepID=A0A939D9L0_CLOAM|nr:nitroreductase family protein [Clostridium aminobutyricum]MBN7773587.1 nitroreductase family protein [Clostridium aminobutyricum]
MLFDILKSRRSIRKFQNKEVEKEKIDVILKSALLSPSSRSIRPWQFIAVTDAELLQQLSLCREPGPQFLADAPLAIVVIADKNASDVWIEDTSVAATIIQLTVQDLGLGSCWIQVRERFHTEQEKAEEYIRKVLEIPEQYSVECMIAMGYPAEEKKPYEENQLLYQKLHFNKF